MSFGSERAHELLQLVDWSYSLSKARKEDMNKKLGEANRLIKGPNDQFHRDASNALKAEFAKGYYPGDPASSWNACDPEGDPLPRNPDDLDDDIADYTHIAGYNIPGKRTVEANMFEKGGIYYILNI
jgi:hypothetical protein